MEVHQIRAGEYYGLILFGAVGMCLMSSAVDLVLIFIALEISSISTYILAGFRRRAAISSEASVKYFLLGSFATAFFLYGIALMFGATGSTSISAISQVLRSGNIPVLAYAGIALMFVGLGFKVAAAPFHIWTPDVYEGAPSPVVGFMSTAPKAAVFAVLLRIMFEANAPGRLWLIWVTAALSLIGIPITGGCFAKFYVFSAALQANLVGLVIIGVLNSAVGAYYYLRVMVVMYMREPREEAPLPPVPTGLRAALTLTVFATIYLGILPGRVLEYASRSATELLRQ